MSIRYYADGGEKRFILRFISLFLTAGAGVLVLFMLMPAVSAVVNAGYNGLAASEENANWSAMAKAPTAAFSGAPRSGPEPLSVTFTDKTKGSITSRLWEYKLHAGSTWTVFTLDEASAFSFTTAGIYDVRLTVTGADGSDTKTELSYIKVNEAAPVAAFYGTPSLSGPEPLTVSFTDTSTGSISSYSWIFGDGTTSAARNPSHTYTTVGSYTVTLTVIGPGGSDSESKTNYITVTNATTWIGIYKDGIWYLDVTWNRGTPASIDTVFMFGSPGWKKITGDWNNDGKSDIGVTNGQLWYLDMNNNGAFDSGIDAAYSFGAPGWTPVVGDWSGTGSSSIGVTNGQLWYLDGNGNGAWDGADKAYTFGAPGWTPVVGDWGGTGSSSIGVTNGQLWYLDGNGNGAWDGADKAYSFGAPGWTPVLGDWNGDGKSEIGVYKDGMWYLDQNGNGVYGGEVTTAYTFRGEPGWSSVTGDWNGDGKTKIGIYREGAWYLDWNGNGVWEEGTDTVYNNPARSDFIPVIGDWNGDGRSKIGVYRWGYWSLDFSGAGTYTDFPQFIGPDEYAFSPIVGDWNGDGRSKMGVYRATDGEWYLDYDGNREWNSTADTRYNFDVGSWSPVIGDWNGDGRSKMGVFKDGAWRLDYYGNGSLIKICSFGITGSRPFAGDWNGDGKSEVGVYHSLTGDWNLDYDGNGVWGATLDKKYNFGMGTPVVGTGH